ncbi:hypothetical protein D3C80_2168700 [compost metagenome]
MLLLIRHAFRRHFRHWLQLRSSFQQRCEFSVARIQRLLALHQFGDLVLHHLLIEHLTAGDAINLGAKG